MARGSRKKEKQRLKREKKKQALRKASSENPFRRIAKSGQPLECWVSSTWRSNGLADIFVRGHVPGGSDCLAVFLIDLYCVGLKDGYGRKDLTRAQIREEFLEPREKRGGKLDRIDVGEVRKLVAGAIRFSRQNGFALPPHYERWTAILGDLGDVQNADLSDFGPPQGGLLYIGNMDFLRRRYIAGTPEEFLARPDVKFMGPAEDFLSEFDDGSEFDEETDEQKDDITDASDMAEIMGSISSKLADSVRAWCFANGKIPSPMIDLAADMVLTRMIIKSAAAESPQGDAPFEEISDLLDDFLVSRSDEERLEMAIAVGQFKDFMHTLSSPRELFKAAGLLEGEINEDSIDEPDSRNPTQHQRFSTLPDIVEQADRSRNTAESSHEPGKI